ncbi:MAG: type III pantothenate kinase [Acidobacteriota bacterium]
MLLAVDIGNTSIKFGLFDGEELTSKFSISTKRDATADEIKLAVGDRLRWPIEAAIACSVVPQVEEPIRRFLLSTTKIDPIFVNNSFDFRLKINYEPLESLGTDRLVNAFAAVEKYGAPCIICSLGTATTIDVVNDKNEFMGGIIAPGIDAMAEALHLKAARLPNVEIEKPVRMLAHSTAESIRSGVYYGYVAMVEGLITRVRTESGVARVVATGGNAAIFAACADIVEPALILNGLRLLHRFGAMSVPPA